MSETHNKAVNFAIIAKFCLWWVSHFTLKFDSRNTGKSLRRYTQTYIMSNYKPNHIPKNERIFNFLWGSGLLIWAVYGLIAGELIIPGRRGREDTVFTEAGLYFIVTAFVLGSVNMFLLIVDHYDKRDNEINYKYTSRVLIFVGFALIIAAFVSNKETTNKKASPSTELASLIKTQPT